jgi:sucrose-6F-phosphate phosphohydrolase
MRSLLITDLDNTLVGDLAALNLLNDRLMQSRQQQETLLVYSTGRSLTSYRHLCSTVSLLPPDVLITAVGTEIYQGNGAHLHTQWSAHLKQSWDRTLVQEIAGHFIVLEPQPDSEQRPFKVSYFLDAAIADPVMTELSGALESQGLCCQLIYSGGKDLDILPQNADKGKAMQFVQTQFEIDDLHTVACGDSGNDIALFRQNRGIIVGNAQPELLNWHYQNPASHRYLATAHFAAGILEGLAYFEMLV